MLSNENPYRDRRAAPDRRRGPDFRSAEAKRLQGERRLGGDRRAQKRTTDGVASTGRLLLYACVALMGFCVVDVRYNNGQHSVRVAQEAGDYASGMAGKWVGAGFGR